MNEYADKKENIENQFEAIIAASAPRPRAAFEAALEQQLRHQFAQHERGRQMRRATSSRRYRWLVAMLVVGFTVGIGIVIAMSTFLQQFIDHDPGLKTIYEQGLGHEIGLSQTIDDFTVTLEWAYADGNRLTLAYIIQGKAGMAYTNLFSNVYKLTLRDTGAEISPMQGMTTAIDQNGDRLTFSDAMVTFDRSLSIMSYDLSPLALEGRSALDLQLELAPSGVTIQHRTQLPNDFFSAAEGPDEPFRFDFSVAVIDEQRVFDTSLTAMDQDITIHLRTVQITPSQTRVIICFMPPDPARQWTAVPRLSTEMGEVTGGGGVRPFMDGNESCQDYTYFAGMFSYTGGWRLEITELIGFGSGGGNDQQRISGSWLFEFAVP